MRGIEGLARLDFGENTKADRWSGLQLRTLLLCFLLNMLEGADVLVVSFVAPVLTKTWSISDAAFGLVFSSGLAGMTRGALVLAPFADVWGHKALILVASAVIASGMMLSALTENVMHLVAVRFWTGLGIGSMLASVTALASVFAPGKFRSFAVTVATAGYPAGATAAGLSAGWTIPQSGWQGMFVIVGLCSALLPPILLLALPELVEFLLTRRTPEALSRANRYRMAHGLPGLAPTPSGARASRSRPPVGHLLRPGLTGQRF